MATILIVDDIQANRSFLVAVLEQHGHRIIEAGDGHEALEAAGAYHPDLVITDVLMPIMDGYEFTKRLRQDPATRSIPVLFYTAHYGEREATALARARGAAGILTKPLRSAKVLEVVERVLAGVAQSNLGAATQAWTSTPDPADSAVSFAAPPALPHDLKSANERLVALINIAVELASEGDVDRRLASICAGARQLFDATYVTIGIVTAATDHVERVVTCGTETPNWIRSGDSLSGVLRSVVRERRTVSGASAGGDPRTLELPVVTAEVQAYAALPIASTTRVYGWICLATIDEPCISDDDVRLATVLADQVGRILDLEHEIAERQHAEAALRQERDRAQGYLDTAQVILLQLDLDGRIALVNRYACWVLGWSADELTGRDWVETCVPERLRARARHEFDNMAGGNLAVMENRILKRSGEERLIEWRNSLLLDDAGRVNGTLSSGTDITDRVLAAEVLRTVEERTRFALDAAGVGIWDMDFTTGVLQWSGILESQYGLPAGSFGGTFDAFVDRVHPDDVESMLATMTHAKESGDDFTLEHRTVWPDGTVHWLNGAGRIRLGALGQPVRGTGISLDVTARHSLEEQYQQAQKMEAIGRLAGGVAHDFNNLLTAILGYCELLLLDLAADDHRRSDIAEIQKAGTSAAGLTRQLLAFSRKQIIEPAVLDLNGIVTYMQAMVARVIGEDIAVVIDLEPGLAHITADRGQVEQIVMNLAVNARDAMRTGGTLTIETANVMLDEEYARTHLSITPGCYVALTVTDSGTGMTPAVQARLFEPFFTTKDVGHGTGLGLATVHGIAVSGGGSVNVSSELGMGSSFKVYFPATAADAVVKMHSPASSVRAGGETILVVDDAEGLRDLTMRMLQRQGYRVLVAANAEEALRLFSQHSRIDVLLTDVVMPGASGPELTNRLIDQQPNLKVIFMSGYTDDVIVHHGILNPGIAFLNKPFTSGMLGTKLREVLDRTPLGSATQSPLASLPAAPPRWPPAAPRE